jgi:recombination protein RecA
MAKKDEKKEPEVPVDDLTFFKTGASKGTVKNATDDLNSDIAHYYSMGLPIDVVLGGGVPAGRIIEIFGPPSHGKSALALEMAIAYQKYWKALGRQGVIQWIESESVFDKLRAHRFGMDVQTVLIKETNICEEAFELMYEQCKKSVARKVPIFIVWDTIAATITRNESLYDPADPKSSKYAGGQMEKPRVNNFWLRKLHDILAGSDVTLVLVNQIYGGQEGEETPGGNGIKFFSSIRINVRKTEEIREALKSGLEMTKAIVSNIQTVKNKITLPNIKIPIVIRGEEGIDRMETVVRYLRIAGKTKVAGSWQKLECNGKEYSFQNADGLREIIEMKDPMAAVLVDYLCYQSFADLSVLLKVKYFRHLQELEEKLGFPKTTLSPEEIELAKLIYSNITKADADAVPEDVATVMASPATPEPPVPPVAPIEPTPPVAPIAAA